MGEMISSLKESAVVTKCGEVCGNVRESVSKKLNSQVSISVKDLILGGLAAFMGGAVIGIIIAMLVKPSAPKEEKKHCLIWRIIKKIIF